MLIFTIGQEETLREFCKLSVREQNEIIDFINELPTYIETNIKDVKYIMVHGGLPAFSKMDLDYYEEDELLFGPHDYNQNHYNDANIKIIVGHTPTSNIDGAEPNKINYLEDTIAIDCGCGFGGKLGVLCLETMVENYF